MKQIITGLIASVFILVTSFLAVPNLAYACSSTDNSSKGQVLTGVGATGSDCSASGVTTAVHTAIEILSMVAGIAAVVMVIIAGFRYTTSGGDSGRVASAKSTLIYALVGIAIAVLAQVIVHFVVVGSSNAADGKCHDGKAAHASLSADNKDCKS